MTGSSLTPIVVPIVGIICLAALLAIVYYADSHPEWKHAGQEPGHRAIGPPGSPAVTPGAGAGQLPGEPGHLSGEPGHLGGEPPSA